jgi:SAM-dependent methyltransferase
VLKMYGELADWWTLLSPPAGYQEEAASFWQVFARAGLGESPSLLELGSGGGNTARYLKEHFAPVTLCDLSPDMLSVSRSQNPACEHVLGDMRTLQLDREFDAVFVHDAICYMTTLPDLERAMQTAFVHCRKGGAALFVPDDVRETFEASTQHGGSDSGERGMRYLEWSWDPDETDSHSTTDYVYLLREGAGPMRVEHERHVLGLFSRAAWLSALERTGFEAEIIEDSYGRDLFFARKG